MTLVRENGLCCRGVKARYALETAFRPLRHVYFLASTVVGDCVAVPRAVSPLNCPDHATEIVPVALSAVEQQLRVVVAPSDETTTEVVGDEPPLLHDRIVSCSDILHEGGH